MKQDFLDWVAECTVALVFILILIAASVGKKNKK
jgi:hypothetical protein